MLPFSHTVAILTCWEAKSLHTMPETSESMYVSQTFEERLCSMAPLWLCLVLLCRILGPRC